MNTDESGENHQIPSLWRLATPVLIEQTLTMLVGLTDFFLTGRYLQQQHLAAMGLLQYLLWMLPTLFAAVAIGATAMTARFVGAGDRLAANRVLHQSLLIGAVLMAAVTLGLSLGGRHLVRVLQMQGESADLTVEFLNIVLWSVPLLMVEVVGVACLRGAGRMGSGLLVMAGVNVVNTVAALLLMRQWGLGWRGLAMATACGHITGGLLVIALFAVGQGGLRWSLALFRPDRELIHRLLKIGLPGGLDQAGVMICHFGFVSMINGLGELATAAHGVALRVESLCYPPAVAFHYVAATLAGQHLGARQPHLARDSVRKCWLWGTGFMTLAGLVFFVFADPLPRLFVRAEHEPVSLAASQLLRILAFSMPGFATVSILNGGFRGAGDTRWPLAVNFIGLLGIRLPMVWLLAYAWKFGVDGAWFAVVADLTVRGGLVMLRLRQGGWLEAKV
ncbi:MAG: MATE family efflux transporter [Pirellulales bacterium]